MQKVVLYVSNKGNDKWSGKIPDPKTGAGDGPLATIEAARDAIRRLRRREAGNRRGEGGGWGGGKFFS